MSAGRFAGKPCRSRWIFHKILAGGWLILLLGTANFAHGQQSTNTEEKKDEPEEPDFGFLGSSAYTQVKQTLQFIHASSYGTRRFPDPGGRRNEDEYLFFQRAEYGITDRWEVDLQMPFQGSRTRANGMAVAGDGGLGDMLLGVRYQVLHEGKAPVAMTMGPQVIFPSGSARKGTGNNSIGLAWDFAMSKDWRGPVFWYGDANYHAFPRAADTTPGSTSRFALHGVSYATTLGFRAMERNSGSVHHDIHAYLEGAGAWEQEIEPGISTGARRGKLTWQVSPGIRYGHLSQRQTLIEIGFAAPVGLGPNGPKQSFIVQFQYEFYFHPPK
jgi:hypothetical protein